ncbi:TetR/AcrR family transcriptional regulator C-terminal domain-containing protein [Pseudonocardia acaciae]|uniref:TetR/AcrR family transcriptional regulator C-terminal domain-containing protein n=1 Tax=Pseudonocardia acaciae TaxID=551276 RepID=UPI00048D1270|nr:TetR/AcrR family transcriptional regulator C-terminal domain-containing protein [Pseudonocardia acaciae]
MARTVPKGLTVTAVLDAALAVLDAEGLDGLSTRAIAARLDVSMQTVLWHVKDKRRLLELLIDRIIGEVSYDDLPDHWESRTREIMRRLRATLLSHRDSAQLMTGMPSIDPNVLRFENELISALLDGLPRREAVWTSWTLTYFVQGLVGEEQRRADGSLQIASTEEHPALHEVSEEIATTAFPERFEFGLDVILRHSPRS